MFDMSKTLGNHIIFFFSDKLTPSTSKKYFRDSRFDQNAVRESGKRLIHIDGIRVLTVSWEAGLTQNWARDAGFMFACLSGMLENRHDSSVLAAMKINQASAKWCLFSNQTSNGVPG